MSDSLQNFEFILKKNNTKRPLGLYSDNKQQNKHNLKPQDVISSVSMQLKAIQIADSLKSDKNASKDLQKYKKSIFLSVNNLPVYEEVPKITTKFDTQCVSDTQLINIIEDAEIIDVHRGMTQEFESTFFHHTEKEDVEKIYENLCIEENEKESEDIKTEHSDKVAKNRVAISDKESMNNIHANITKAKSLSRIENNIEAENSISLISPIMCSNNVIDRKSDRSSQGRKNHENTQIEENSQIFHDCIEIDEDIDIDKSIEKPLSPIFMHKSVQTKSKTPSPLIFNLEKFERFEKIAIPMLEVNDMKTTKRVIDSQILDKELCFQMDEEIVLNERDILSSPVLQNKDVQEEHKEFETDTVKDSNLDTDLEFMKLDKATSEDLINKIMNEDPENSKVKAESEILKDEILFSSDEEDNYIVHKSYQDLPFTCALETSFYDQSDVLNKTMYVGFQTASNKSIQIFTESFAQAKSILSGELTVTDLVNNCDSSVKNKTEVHDETQAKVDLVDEQTEFNLAQTDDRESEGNAAEKPDNIQAQTSNFEGFMTASKKVIRLSQKALARCKKVFQDIDLNDNFDTQIEEENLGEPIELERDKISVVSISPDREVNKNLVEEEIHNIDDEIIQEFENIEMSLNGDKEPDKNVDECGLNKDIKISETAKMGDVCKDIDFDEDLAGIDIGETNIEQDALPTKIENSTPSEINLKGFKTASNKNINISKEALAKTKTIFQDLGSTEFPNKSIKSVDKEYQDLVDFEQPSTNKETFVGFKTANNKNIKISEHALAKVHNIFKDIDKSELPKKDIPDKTNEDNVYDQPSPIKMSFVGFKTANNKDINIYKDALAETKRLFDGIDATDFTLPAKNNTNLTEIYPEESESIDCNQPSTSKCSFVSFKTASNKNVKLSEAALSKTKNIFKDIDNADFKFPDKGNKIHDEEIIGAGINARDTTITTSCFKGFTTANNKEIIISDNALAKTKDFFKDLDSDGFKFPSNKMKNIEEDVYERTDEIEMIDLNIPPTSTASFAGFKTANNKKINITKEAWAKTKNIFNDIDVTDFKLPEKSDKSVKTVEGTVKINDKMILRDPEDFNQPSTSKAVFIGFKTANNRNITISKDSLAKTKYIFKDMDETYLKFPEKVKKNLEETVFFENKNKVPDVIDINQPSTSKASFSGFKTANNKKINISEESLALTKYIFKDMDEMDFKFPEKDPKVLQTVDLIENMGKEREEKSTYDSEIIDFNQPSTSKASFAGFKTANNKKINISEDSLAKTKNIFKDLDSNEFSYSKKPEKELQDKTKEGKTPYPDLKASVQPTTIKPSFKGFKTANNKVIKVSETALAKSKNLFKDIDSTEFKLPEKVKDNYPDIEIDDMEPKISKDPMKTRNNDFRMPETVIPKFQGFQTASNKEVTVSADALFKSRKIFEDIGVSQDLNAENKGKYVLDPVKDSLHIHKGRKHDSEECNTDRKGMNDKTEDYKKDDLCKNGKSSPIFKGFQTANKKPVNISEETLAKRRRLFQDIETIQDDPEPEFHGFKTGNDGEVEVSQKTLIETKKLFEDVMKRSGFQGFQTASDKQVKISEDALAKSKKMFQDVDKNVIELRSYEKKPTHIKFEFKTGSNRDVKVSDEAIARSKRRFSEIDDSKDNITNKKKDKVTNEDSVANIIDTQVQNNFDESLHTEDFHDSPVKSKRSGSPILSCPRAKKRKKFETPYSQKLPVTVKKKESPKTTKDRNKLTFTENYKKNKKYTLKDLAELTKNYNIKVDTYLQKITFDNLLQFEFFEHRNDLTDGKMSMELLKNLFLDSVNSKLIPTGWIENHLKLILWKLICYEIKFKSSVVTARNLIDQLKYRYDKELYDAERPALRKILEKDDVASKTLVLCVAGIYVDGVGVASVTTTNNLELLLTDGWYCVKASIDKMLAQLVCQGQIVIGSKIVTNGAELVNCEQGISPWEDTSAVRLKLFGNSTRRARWDARLGYHGNAAILSQLSSVKLNGGKVSKLRVFVTRVYPALYVEKFEDGSTVTRSERLEHLHQMKSEVERQVIMEKIYEEVEKEFSDDESQDSEGLTDSTNTRTCLDSGSQIAKVMKRSKDPAEFRAGLTSSQTRLLECHATKHREHLLQNIQQKIRQKIEKAGVCVNRTVVTLVKIRVAGVNGRGEVTKGMMSIWKPPEAVLEIIKEGAWIDVMNVVPTAVRYSEIQISAGRQSVFNTSKYKEPENIKPYTNLLKRICYTIKYLSHNPSMATDYNEIDTVGFIFLIDPSTPEFDSTKQPFQNVFLADAEKNMICINFWGGLKKFGYQNVFDTGHIVYCANLQKRAGNTRKSIPQYRVTEFSYFTKTPKNENAKILVDDLSKKFLSLDRRKFCEDCVVLKNNYAVIKLNNENISPYRFNTSDYNMSKNKMFIDSPLTRPIKPDDNFNLTGLDFESTFKQTDTQNLSEEVLQRKKKVNEKIARLKMYGEPPPLSTIHIINISKNASNSYKSPLNSSNKKSKIIPEKSKSESAMSKSDSFSNVARVEETPEKGGNLNDSDFVCSPLLLNRTYVKSVNPVKINFDMKDNNDSNVDHFAEEFDGSPPLSLD